MAGTLTINNIQLGDSSTASQNFVLRTNSDGTATLARGNVGSTSQDILTIGADGNVEVTKTTATSMVRLNTANGYGSTNTKIRRFTNVVTNQGTDITYADSATLGASFTINTNGVYTISYSDCFTTPAVLGLSINSSQLTTNLESITATNILSANTSGSNHYVGVSAWTGYLTAGDIIRPHSAGVATGSVVNTVQFTIARVS